MQTVKTVNGCNTQVQERLGTYSGKHLWYGHGASPSGFKNERITEFQIHYQCSILSRNYFN